MRHRTSACYMDADKVGDWAPFMVALILLSIAGWGIWDIPSNSDVVEGLSEDSIPHFIEHFPTMDTDRVPEDDILRLAWHPEDSELGSLKTNDRFLELGEQSIVEHTSEPANAILQVSVSWVSENSFNVTVYVNTSIEIENGILRIIVVEDNVEMFGRTPSQHAVVRLYDPTPIGEGNGSISRNLQMPYGLSVDDAENLELVVLLSNMMTEENHALISLELPLHESGPIDNGQRVATWFAISAGILVLAAIVRAEWKREVFLPRLRGQPGQNGLPIAHLKAGIGSITLREVRVLPPWKLAKQIRDVELKAGAEKTFQVHLKPSRGHEELLTEFVQTEWSIEVEEMGAWVLDLTLYKEPPT